MSTNLEQSPATSPAPSDPPESKRAPSRKVLLLLILLIGALTAWYATSDRVAPSTNRGTVQAYVKQIPARVSGQVTNVAVEDNAFVTAGQTLFELDRRPFELQVQQAEVSLAQALQSTAATAASISANQAAVSQATANLENVSNTYERNVSLFERGVITRAALDNSQAQLQAAQASVDSAKAQLETAMLQLGETDPEKRPQIMSARLQLEQAQLNLEYSTVVAPTDGVVTNLLISEGQFAAAGSTGMTFIDARAPWITLDMRENQLGNINAGDAVDVLFDAEPGKIFKGHVVSIAWGIDPGRSMSGGLVQNRPENEWYEPARRIPVRVELDSSFEEWPAHVRAGGKVTAVVHAISPSHPLSRIANAKLRFLSWLSYLY